MYVPPLKKVYVVSALQLDWHNCYLILSKIDLSLDSHVQLPIPNKCNPCLCTVPPPPRVPFLGGGGGGGG